MLIVRLRSGSSKWAYPLPSMCSKRLSSASAAMVSVEEPQYPPILEQGPLVEKLRKKEKWHDWIKSHETVEEKLFELNMPKYYGWRSVVLRDNDVPFNFLPWAQFACRTHLEVADKISPLYEDTLLESLASKLTSQLKSDVENVILCEYHCFRRKYEIEIMKKEELTQTQLADIYTSSFVKHLNRVLLTGIVSDAKHLNMTTVVPDPRVEAFWFLGGINPTQEKIRERLTRTKMTHFNVRKGFLHPSLVDGPVNEPVQFYGNPILQLQSRHPLPYVENLLEENPQAKEIPHVPYEPSVFYLDKQYRRATTVPGFWPGEPHEFGMMSFHSSNFLNSRPCGPEDSLAAAHSSAIFSSFSWLLAQACYQGFSIFHDITYPLLTQTALTNGKDWSFYLYQLNTTLLHTMNSTKNPRCNLCWGTKPASLFQEIQDGRVIGLNEDVLKQIIKMYLIEPKERDGVQLKPYLAKKPYVANLDFEERRDWLERQYKHLTSNRPRKYEKPEMYAWEYIYRVKHNDMIRMKKTQWFMTQGAPPDCRRLDDHPKVYKPNALRTEEDMKFIKQIRRVFRQYYPGTNKEPLIPPGK